MEQRQFHIFTLVLRDMHAWSYWRLEKGVILFVRRKRGVGD